jgi:broad specificity phosphatase PhoE
VTILLLARHGETDWNRESRFQGHADPPLNELGREQARGLAQLLAGDQIAALYTSPLRRAVETAEIVGRRLRLPVNVDTALMEVDVGSWSGLTHAQIAEQFPESWQRWLDYGPGWDDGESYEQLGLRAVPAVLRLARRHHAERILLITHGGVIRCVLAHAAGIPYEMARRLHPVAENCGLTAVGADEDGSLRRID